MGGNARAGTRPVSSINCKIGLFSFKNLADFLGFEGSFPYPVSFPSNGWEPWLQTAPTGAGHLKSSEKMEN